MPPQDEGVANHDGVGGAGGVPCRRRGGAVEETNLGLRLSECGWSGWRMWLTGRPWTPPPERTFSFFVLSWEQEAHPRLEESVVPSEWLIRRFGVGDQQYVAEVVGEFF